MENGEILGALKSNPSCSVKQSLIGLHKVVISLYTLRTPSSDGDQQIYGQRFFYSVPGGVFNLISSFTGLEEFGRLHCEIDSSKLIKSHREPSLCPYAHHAEPLFEVFTAFEAMPWTLFVRTSMRGAGSCT